MLSGLHQSFTRAFDTPGLEKWYARMFVNVDLYRRRRNLAFVFSTLTARVIWDYRGYPRKRERETLARMGFSDGMGVTDIQTA